MSELTTYDSQGYRYRGSDGASRAVSERIEAFFFGGVRVYLDVGARTELVVFFRAHETASGRAEQYFAVYQTETRADLFGRFKDALRRRVEREYGMTLQTTSGDVELFAKLDDEPPALPGAADDHRLIDSLLRAGESLRLGVRDADGALALLATYAESEGRTLAIAENTRIAELDDCDLAIEVGSDEDLTPIGETAAVLAAARGGGDESSGDDGLFSRPRATNAGERVRSRLEPVLRTFEPAFRILGPVSGLFGSASRAIESALGTLESALGALKSALRIGALAVGGLLVLGIVAIVLANVAAAYDLVNTNPVDPIVVVDGDANYSLRSLFDTVIDRARDWIPEIEEVGVR